MVQLLAHRLESYLHTYIHTYMHTYIHVYLFMYEPAPNSMTFKTGCTSPEAPVARPWLPTTSEKWKGISKRIIAETTHLREISCLQPPIFIVDAKNLEQFHPHALQIKVQGISALVILSPCSNFLGFAVKPQQYT